MGPSLPTDASSRPIFLSSSSIPLRFQINTQSKATFVSDGNEQESEVMWKVLLTGMNPTRIINNAAAPQSLLAFSSSLFWF